MTAILPWQRKQDSFMRSIKRNQEFARWWDGWTSRIQRSRAQLRQSRIKSHAGRTNFMIAADTETSAGQTGEARWTR